VSSGAGVVAVSDRIKQTWPAVRGGGGKGFAICTWTRAAYSITSMCTHKRKTIRQW
jgi:hypothetical protein